MTLLWSIGSADSRSPDLSNTYTAPNSLGDVVRHVVGGHVIDGAWPNFHPSEADPDAGYRLHPYTIEFSVEHEPTHAYLLAIQYLAIAPRLANLDVDVNGVRGQVYLRPHPSQSGEIRLHAGLHAAIYSEGVSEVVIPASMLRRGVNRLVLTARDTGEVLHVEGIERVLRLDRMANASGFVYQHITFSHLEQAPAGAIATHEVQPSPVYLRSADDVLVERCHLYLDLSRGTPGGKLRLTLADLEQEIVVPPADFGHLHIVFELPDGTGPVPYRMWGTLGADGIDVSGTLTRARKWQVYVAPHAHTDIGYTHRQWEVAERLCINIDRALELLERPDTAQAFAYHLDASWALETYRETRSHEQWVRLERAIGDGHIGVAAGYADLLTQYAALEDLIRNLGLTDAVLRPLDRSPEFAAVVDVASLTGSLPAVLEGSGVRYLLHANNQDRGPFRLYGGLHRRSPYYWEGPSGGRVLVWLSRMYCELRKVCGSPPVPDSAERGLQLWLEEYDRPDYAPDAVLMYGQEADNTDLDPQPIDFIRRWNERYEYPRLIPSTVVDFFHYVEERCASSFPAVRGDGGAYWEDGAGSTAIESFATRRAQASLPAAETLESLAVMHIPGRRYPLELFDDAWRQVLLFDEHTWGSALSVADPEALLQGDTWSVKAGMAREAELWATRLLHGSAVTHSLQWNTNGREIAIYNPHSWPVSGPAVAEIQRDERVVDAGTGRDVPVRLVCESTTQKLVELWTDLPGLSYRRFPLTKDPPADAAPAARPLSTREIATLENHRYRIQIDPGRGCAVSFTDKVLDRELVDSGGICGLGAFLYAEGGEGTRLISNQADLPEGNPRVIDSFRCVSVDAVRNAHAQEVRLVGQVEAGTLTIEWSLPDRADWVDLRYRYEKEERLTREAAYVAFPFDLPNARVLSDSQIGWVDWARDELPGACKEWLPLQSAILLKGDVDVLICSPEVPLFCVGETVRGRWPREMDLTGGTVFSYVLNNYWHTNYKASQGGEICFSYRLMSDGSITPDRAYRTGREARRPLYGHRLSFQDFRRPTEPYSAPDAGVLAELGSERIVVTTMKKSRWADGFVVRLQEIAGEPGIARLALPPRQISRAWSCDLLEREMGELPMDDDCSVTVNMQPWQVTTVRFELCKHAK